MSETISKRPFASMNEKLDRLLALRDAAEHALETATKAGEGWYLSNDVMAELDLALAPYRLAETARHAEASSAVRSVPRETGTQSAD